MTHAEVAALEPQHKLFLQIARQALADVPRGEARWRGSATGVYVGISAPMFTPSTAIGAHALLGNSPGAVANRLSYLYDLGGPSLAFDALCASGLVALDAACRALRDGSIRFAVAGAVRARVGEAYVRGADSMGTLSRSGRCLPFDARADGI